MFRLKAIQPGYDLAKLPEPFSHLLQVQLAMGEAFPVQQPVLNLQRNQLKVQEYAHIRRVLVVPGAGSPLRQPLARSIARLIFRLFRKGTEFRVIVHGESEEYIGEISAAGRAFGLVEEIRDLSLLEYVEQFAWPGLVICADSSAQHIASERKCAVIVLAGPNRPEVWGPWSPVVQSVVLQRVDCPYYPCDQRSCHIKSPCIDNISPNFVDSIIQ